MCIGVFVPAYEQLTSIQAESMASKRIFNWQKRFSLTNKEHEYYKRLQLFLILGIHFETVLCSVRIV